MKNLKSHLKIWQGVIAIDVAHRQNARQAVKWRHCYMSQTKITYNLTDHDSSDGIMEVQYNT